MLKAVGLSPRSWPMKHARSLLRFQSLLIALTAILVVAVTARSAPLTDTEKAAIVILLGKNYDFGDVIKGRTIDGYLQGATVFLDINGNGTLWHIWLRRAFRN